MSTSNGWPTYYKPCLSRPSESADLGGHNHPNTPGMPWEEWEPVLEPLCHGLITVIYRSASSVSNHGYTTVITTWYYRNSRESFATPTILDLGNLQVCILTNCFDCGVLNRCLLVPPSLAASHCWTPRFESRQEWVHGRRSHWMNQCKRAKNVSCFAKQNNHVWMIPNFRADLHCTFRAHIELFEEGLFTHGTLIMKSQEPIL